MAWEWVGLGLVFLLARQLIATDREARGLVAVMIALAVVLSAIGLFQIYVALPVERAAYAENPDQVLMDLGQWFPEGSPQRARFEDRLASTEPMGTFALANSLAGYSAPWMIMALGVLWSSAQAPRRYGLERRGDPPRLGIRRGRSGGALLFRADQEPQCVRGAGRRLAAATLGQ